MDFPLDTQSTIILFITLSLGAIYLFLSRQSIPLPPPDEIVDLRIYPIKSCRGFQVKSARLLRTGFDLDRNWMFISAKDREFITIRAHSEMTLIRTSYDAEADVIHVTIKDQDCKIEFPAHPTQEWLKANTTISTARIWGEETDAWEYPTTLTQPIADFLNSDIRLVYKGPKPRVLRGSGKPEILGRTEAVKFADMMPVQVSSMASMTELNQRLRKQDEPEIDIERFRPNIVIRGSQPWNEDNWKTLRINGSSTSASLDLDVVCRCLRCQVPNVDPSTGEKHARQPWNTLMKYRRIDPGLKFKPSFGMLCAPRAEGVVEVGMRFDVMGLTDDHYFISPMK